MLAHTPCLLCNPTDSVPVANFSIRIKPTSSQTRKTINKTAFKSAIKSRCYNFGLLEAFSSKSLCVNIIFVVNPKMTPADVDNLAKLLLDSFNECIYEDDKIIDHLNLLRIAYGGVEEYIEVRISDSNVNTHTDVLYHGLNHVWGMDELLLENFYEAD
jgi:Holliday junction resolvase RusA-like endonuclease